MPTHYYSSYGMTLVSEFELPELEAVSPATPDLTIVAGKLRLRDQHADGEWFACECKDDGVTLLAWKGVAAFEIAADGRRITVDCCTGVEPALMRLPLLGAALGVALRNRGLLVLHASAVEVEGRAALFIGRSGAGKSTMTAMMHQRGHTLIADDVVALEVDPRGMYAIRVLRGIDRCKLWPDSANAVGCRSDTLQTLHSQVDKLNVPLPSEHRSGFRQSGLPLGSLSVLSIGDAIELAPVSSQDALLTLLANTFVTMVSPSLQGPFAAQDLLQCSRIVRQLEVKQLRRPADLTLLPQVAELIEKAILSGNNHQAAGAAA